MAANGKSMTRKQFIRNIGIGAAALGAAGLGLGRTARASSSMSPADGPGGLLDGAATFVGPQWNPSLGKAITSAVTAVKFHTNLPDNTGTPGAVYIPSYEPGGLVDEPAPVEKTVNGIHFREYTGELSGHMWHLPIADDLVYGPIGASDEPQSWTSAREGLKGVYFALRIPDGWNGALLEYVHGSTSIPHNCYSNAFDEMHLLSEGFAYFIIVGSGTDSKDETNRNNDGWWKNGHLGIFDRVAHWLPTNRRPSDSTSSYEIMYNPLFLRDTVRVMKNICRKMTGKEVGETYLYTHSASGLALMSLSTGRLGYNTGGNYVTPYANCPFLPDGSGNPQYDTGAPMVYDGFIGFSPGGAEYVLSQPLNPKMPMSSAPIFFYDGVGDVPNLSLAMYAFAYRAHKASTDPVYGKYWPETKSTVFTYALENMPHQAHEQELAMVKNGSGVYADGTFTGFEDVDTNGDGVIDQAEWDAAVNKKFFATRTFQEVAGPDGLISPAEWKTAISPLVNDIFLFLNFNTEGRGKEVKWDIGEFYRRKVPFIVNPVDEFGMRLFFTRTTPRAGPFAHKLIDNLHSYVTEGVAPPKGTVDTYWSDGNAIWPKFFYVGPPGFSQDAAHDRHYGLYPVFPPYTTINIGSPLYYGGLFKEAIDYLVSTPGAIDYMPGTIRLPDDAARIGLYESFFAGFFTYVYPNHLFAAPADVFPQSPLFGFTESELVYGFGDGTGNEAYRPLDWKQDQLGKYLPLVTFTMPSGTRIPQDGYKNHGGYVGALSQAVNELVERNLFDPYLGALMVADAAKSDYPLTLSANLGLVKKMLEEKPVLPFDLELQG